MRDDMTKRIAIGLVTATLLAACGPSVYRDSTTPIPGYGNAIGQNSAVMIIDPQPAAAANVDLDLDGRRGAIAIERYRTGTVIPPEEQRTTDVLN
jgi:hypothetical protein